MITELTKENGRKMMNAKYFFYPFLQNYDLKKFENNSLKKNYTIKSLIIKIQIYTIQSNFKKNFCKFRNFKNKKLRNNLMQNKPDISSHVFYLII